MIISYFLSAFKSKTKIGLSLSTILYFIFLSQSVLGQCTNCAVTTDSGDTILTFTSGSGTFTPPTGVSDVDYLVVGGGGGGGNGDTTSFIFTYRHGGGGGGAGGVLTGSFSVSSTTYAITVGAGGSAGVGGSGGSGGDTTFASFVAAGGGGGGESTEDGNNGASGGGGGSQADGGIGSQGSNGGDGHATLFDNRGGGGGGGSGSAGSNGGDGFGGNGGSGTVSNLSGGATTYGEGGDGGDPSNTTGPNGSVNSGSGGAGGWSSGGNGGAGGSGIVIIRYPTPATLVSHYQFDEETWSGATNEVLDSSGSNLHGTAIGGATTGNSNPAIVGNPGSCRFGVFDGVDDYVNISNLSNTLNATASLAFWIRTDQTGSDTGWLAPGVAGVEQAGGEDDIFWGWLDGSGRIGISVGNAYSTKSTIAINDNNWHHIVLTRDHVAGTYKIYIDGSLNTQGGIATGVIGNTYSSIGRIEDTGGSPAYYRGQLDEVKVYSSVLSDAQVASIYAETHVCSAGLCPGETPQGGLIGDYYNGTNLSGSIINSRVDGPVDFNWGSTAPGVSGIGIDQFSVQWNGFIRATESGQYYFRTLSDDGVRLYVDGSLIINRWNDHAVQTDTSAPISLTAGQVYSVRLEFYENGGLAEIRLQWQTPSSGSFSPIPAGPSPLGAGLYSCSDQSVSYYEISHSGNGVTCEAEPITITAYDSLGNTVSPVNGTTILLDTAPATGAWAGGNSFTFDGSSSSTIQYLQQTTPDTLNINVSDGVASESASADPDIEFTDVGIRFYENTSLSALPTQIAGVADADMVLRVVETNTDTGQCVARVQNTTRDVDLGYECRNPTTCSTGQTLSLAGSAVTANNNATTINYSTVNLNFDSNGFAAIPFEFSDVGNIRLHSEIEFPAEGNDPALTVSGTSSEFVVKPDRLIITDVDSSGGDSNPQTTSGGLGFLPAGETFVVRIEAQNADGNLTPGFGREITPESLDVSIENIIYPAGGNQGSLTNATSFVPDGSQPGTYLNNNISWSEVGSLTLLPSLADGDYLGGGAVSENESATIGRFYPADFNLSSSGVSNSCVAGSFSYMGHAGLQVQYQIRARNLSGNVVTNFDNTDLTYTAPTVTLHSENNNDGTDLAARLTVASSAWDDGILNVNDTAAQFARLIDGSSNIIPDGPYTSVNLAVQINDNDNVNFPLLNFKADSSNNCVSDGDCDSVVLPGNLNLRFGQLYLKDVHGPESAAIPMVWQTEYWNGSQFVLNGDDQCSTLSLTDISFVGATTAVNAGADTIDVTLGGVTSTFNFADPLAISDCLTSTDIGFCRGVAGTTYGAPGAIVTYPIDIDLTSYPFLRGDWNQDGDYNDSQFPTTYIRFQHYRGNDRVIYWRERLQ